MPVDRPAKLRYGSDPDGAQVAQLVEHATENRSVGGSIPPLGTISHFAVVSCHRQPRAVAL